MIFSSRTYLLVNSRCNFFVSSFCYRTKKNWIDVLKNNILQGTGRRNESAVTLSPDLLEQLRRSLNRSIGGLPVGHVPSNQENGTTEQNIDSSDYVEKIRSFYPSCRFEN